MHDRVGPAIIAGRAPAAVVRRVALEDYHAARWVAPELALLVANAPDAYAFTIDHTRHYRHWAERFAGLTGVGVGTGELARRLGRCREVGLSDDDGRAREPSPGANASRVTRPCYRRRSYAQ